MAVEYVLVAQLVIAVVAAYFTPSVIALWRGLPRPEMVLAVNALAGWTVIGWLLPCRWPFAGSSPRSLRQGRHHSRAAGACFAGPARTLSLARSCRRGIP